jgi:hypothetical protein
MLVLLPHPFLYFRALWFVFITDQPNTAQMKNKQPQDYNEMSRSWYSIVMYYQLRRIELLANRLTDQDGVEARFLKSAFLATEPKRKAELIAAARDSVKHANGAYETAANMLRLYSDGYTLLTDLEVMSALDRRVSDAEEGVQELDDFAKE